MEYPPQAPLLAVHLPTIPPVLHNVPPAPPQPLPPLVASLEVRLEVGTACLHGPFSVCAADAAKKR